MGRIMHTADTPFSQRSKSIKKNSRVCSSPTGLAEILQSSPQLRIILFAASLWLPLIFMTWLTMRSPDFNKLSSLWSNNQTNELTGKVSTRSEWTDWRDGPEKTRTDKHIEDSRWGRDPISSFDDAFNDLKSEYSKAPLWIYGTSNQVRTAKSTSPGAVAACLCVVITSTSQDLSWG